MSRSELVAKWREERTRRLVARLQRKRSSGQAALSAEILGVVPITAPAAPITAPAAPITSAPVRPEPRPIPRKDKPPAIQPRENKSSLRRKQLVTSVNSAPMTPSRPERLHVTFAEVDESATQSRLPMTPRRPFTPKTMNLVRGLDAWLERRGKSPCLSLKRVIGLNRRGGVFAAPLVAPSPIALSPTIEEPQCLTPEQPVEIVTSPKVEDGANTKKELIRSALQELFDVIKMGYPISAADRLLRAIHRGSAEMANEPLFWECRALITNEGKENDIPSDDFLQQMDILQKKLEGLSLVSPFRKTPARLGLNPNNILNSTGIEFVVGNNIVTPVRRSRRTNAQATTSVRSFFEIDSEVRENAEFRPNASLLNF